MKAEYGTLYDVAGDLSDDDLDAAARAELSLRAIVAEVYGAEDHEERWRQVKVLNDLRDPHLVPAGTELSMPTPAPAARSGG